MRMTEEEFANITKKDKKTVKRPQHKFNAKPQVHDGIRFDSKREGAYYEELKARKHIGEVLFFLRQVPVHLPGNVRYVVDFLVFYADGSCKFIDVKGYDTPLSKTKRKMVEDVYPITIEVVK
jgi:hypothetical protein